MKWFFSRRKAAGKGTYTDQVLEAQTEYVTGLQSDSLPAAAAACVHQYGTKLAACRYQGPSQLTKAHIAEIGRDLCRLGHSRLYIRDTGNDYELVRPVYAEKLTRQGWQITIVQGSKETSLAVMDEQIINLVFNPDTRFPYRGQPLWKSTTFDTAKNIETGMSANAGGPWGLFSLFHSPTTKDDEASLKIYRKVLQTLKGLAGGQRGRTAMVSVQRFTRDTTFEHIQLGPKWETPVQATRDALAKEIAGACGVPFALVVGGNANEMREARREFAGTMQTVCDLVSEGLTEGLQRPVGLSAKPLMKLDLIARSRAFRSLVEAGMPMDEAKEMALIE